VAKGRKKTRKKGDLNSVRRTTVVTSSFASGSSKRFTKIFQSQNTTTVDIVLAVGNHLVELLDAVANIIWVLGVLSFLSEHPFHTGLVLREGESKKERLDNPSKPKKEEETNRIRIVEEARRLETITTCSPRLLIVAFDTLREGRRSVKREARKGEEGSND
jgi:hypothetical protein